MTYSNTPPIRSAIAVIAALYLAGCMSGDHDVKRMDGAGARRHRRAHARIHGRKRQARDRGHGGGNVSRQRDRRLARQALCGSHTLETRPSGMPSRWHNPNTGNAGAITPTHTYRSPGGIYRRE